MSRRSILRIVLLAMLLQAPSLGGHWGGMGQPSQTLHALLHWAGAAHHHNHQVSQSLEGFEDIGYQLAAATPSLETSYHQDQSVDSRHHVGVDACLHLLGLIPASVSSLALLAACCYVVPGAEAAPDGPVLEGPRRPPKFLA